MSLHPKATSSAFVLWGTGSTVLDWRYPIRVLMWRWGKWLACHRSQLPGCYFPTEVAPVYIPAFVDFWTARLVGWVLTLLCSTLVSNRPAHLQVHECSIFNCWATPKSSMRAMHQMTQTLVMLLLLTNLCRLSMFLLGHRLRYTFHSCGILARLITSCSCLT